MANAVQSVSSPPPIHQLILPSLPQEHHPSLYDFLHPFIPAPPPLPPPVPASLCCSLQAPSRSLTEHVGLGGVGFLSLKLPDVFSWDLLLAGAENMQPY